MNDTALAQLFLEARTPNSWTSTPVEESLIRQIYEVARLGPTSANSNPARIVWVRSQEAKERLAPLAFDRNQPKILEAPVIAIIGYDIEFAARADVLFPHNYEAIQALAKSNTTWRDETAFRNGTLQAAYLMMAARALGLDCGGMSGFNNAAVDAEFFAGTTIRSNFLCCMGYGSDRNLFDRLPRFNFDDVNSFV